MGSQTAVYPAAQVSHRGRSPYHPYHPLNDLRHRLPPAVSNSAFIHDFHSEKHWAHSTQPLPHFAPSMSPFAQTCPVNYGQDANSPFFQGPSPYPNTYYNPELPFHGDDLDIIPMSGDDDNEPYDGNTQLRSQQLNTDGTPKRPMNAFMIFARKRRPMVSSEQPTMRTGEISKILSKEWTEMRKEDKQFYLDQAKKLKDTFNTRWPDYVYRRRPNNSRKRRKIGGVSGVGPIRNSDANSDGRVATPIECATANHSGDESQSQSAGSISSPLSTQSARLYSAADYGLPSPNHPSDRSLTPSGTLVGYDTGPTYAPVESPKNFGEKVPLDETESALQFYSGSQDTYYRSVHSGDTFGQNHTSQISSHVHDWHPFVDNVPSGVVGAFTPSPPPICSTPSHLAPHAPNLISPNLVYAPSNWTKAQPLPASQMFEEPSKPWGVPTSLADHHGAEAQESLLSQGDSTATISHLGFRSESPPNLAVPVAHSYGNGGHLMEDGHYHTAYMDRGLTQDSHGPQSASSASPYEGSLSALHGDSSSPYINSSSWAPGPHSN